MKGIIIYLVIIFGVGATTTEEYWKELEKRAEVKFRVTKEVVRVSDNEGGVIEVPVLSSRDLEVKNREKQSYLERGAKLIKELEVNKRQLKFLKEQELVTKATAYEKGLDGAIEYIDIHKVIIETEEEIARIERVLGSVIRD